MFPPLSSACGCPTSSLNSQILLQPRNLPSKFKKKKNALFFNQKAFFPGNLWAWSSGCNGILNIIVKATRLLFSIPRGCGSAHKSHHFNLEGDSSVSQSVGSEVGLGEWWWTAAGTHGTGSASVPLGLSRCCFSLKTCFECLSFEAENKSEPLRKRRPKAQKQSFFFFFAFSSFQMDPKYFSYASKHCSSASQHRQPLIPLARAG